MLRVGLGVYPATSVSEFGVEPWELNPLRLW